MFERWQNQEEAYQFAMSRPACMLAMDMGTGKTRVAIDVATDRVDVRRVLVVCPKAVINVWPKELEKHCGQRRFMVYTRQGGRIDDEAMRVREFLTPSDKFTTKFVVLNYDSVWRKELGDVVLKAGFDMVILDESHRAKAAGSKVSKFLALLGKRVKYRMCLSGTPMANSPLDIYGQYRFLDRSIFGTNHNSFLQEYAIMGGPERRFVVGLKNQKDLIDRFNSIAYTCKMADITDRLKLPEVMPPVVNGVDLPSKDMKTIKTLTKEFIAECEGGSIVLNSVLTKALRIQQIAAGFCLVQEAPGEEPKCKEMNNSKAQVLEDLLTDICGNVVVFCVFKHDLDTIHEVAEKIRKPSYELSGRRNELDDWKQSSSGILAVQIQAGAEGVDMTNSNHAIYFTLPHSLALYDQSKARLYRPGQTNPVSFMHLIAKGTIDEIIYNTLLHRRDLIDSIQEGIVDWGMLKC